LSCECSDRSRGLKATFPPLKVHPLPASSGVFPPSLAGLWRGIHCHVLKEALLPFSPFLVLPFFPLFSERICFPSFALAVASSRQQFPLSSLPAKVPFRRSRPTHCGSIDLEFYTSPTNPPGSRSFPLGSPSRGSSSPRFAENTPASLDSRPFPHFSPLSVRGNGLFFFAF